VVARLFDSVRVNNAGDAFVSLIFSPIILTSFQPLYGEYVMTAKSDVKVPGKKLGRKRALPSPWAHAYTFEDAQSMGLPSRTTIEKMIADGTLETFYLRGIKMITGDSTRRALHAQDKKEVAA
jgi:hypothetical protein